MAARGRGRRRGRSVLLSCFSVLLLELAVGKPADAALLQAYLACAYVLM